MAVTVDQQLAQLAALRQQGSLSEDEFTQAKASILAPGATSGDAIADPTVLTLTQGFARMSKLVMVVIALTLGIIVSGVASGLEWEPIQRPAAIVVCPNGQFHTGFEVVYGVNEKGVSDATSCTENGVTRDVNSALMFVVLMVIYALPFLLWLVIVKGRNRRKLARQALEAAAPPVL